MPTEFSFDRIEREIERINEIEWPMQEDLEATINGIKDIWELDCDGDMFLYVETFLPAAGQALLVLVTPTPTEILEEYLTPKNLRGVGRRGDKDSRRRKRGRKGHTKVFWGRGIPDTDGLIAGMLPGAETVQGRRVGLTGTLFWSGVQIADRIGWYSLIADVTAEGVTNWMSNLMESRFCSKQVEHAFVATRVDNANETGALWQDRTEMEPSQRKLINWSNDGLITLVDVNNDPKPADVVYRAHHQVRLVNYFDRPDTSLTTRLYVIGTRADGTQVTGDDDQKSISGKGTIDLGVSGKLSNVVKVEYLIQETLIVGGSGVSRVWKDGSVEMMGIAPQ